MTETTQPDPAREWAEAWLEDHPECRLADLAEAVGAVYGDEVGVPAARAVWFADDPTSNPDRSLTRSDIPAGQGPASLHIAEDLVGVRSLRFKGADGITVGVPYGAALAPDAPERAALWDHLAATLPHVTTEEEA